MNLENLEFTPIIKVVGDYCNNRCSYCFYHNLDQKKPRVMNFGILESLIRQYSEIADGHLSFIWHGGEPLLAGLDFFKEVINLQKIFVKHGFIHNSIQTNGTLITNKWAKFFKQNNFGVGVSLDGGIEDHNRFRITHSGVGTFSNTVRGIKTLQRHGMKPSVIQTVTVANAQHTKINFESFINNIGLASFGINPYFDLKGSNKCMINQSLSNDILTRTLIEYVDLWLEHNDDSLRIREIDAYLSGLYGKRARNCSFNGCCRGFCTVDYDGNIYPCDRLSGNIEFYLGTLRNQTFREILSSEKWQNFAHQTQKLPDDCIICEWKDACNNGCTAHRIGGINGKYYFCQSRKEVFKYLQNKIKDV